MARRPDSTSVTRHPSQLLALAIGAVYTLVGIAGFLVTGFDNFASETDKTLLGFEINPLHNIVHLVIGLAGLALWRRLDAPGPMAGCWPPATDWRSCTGCSRPATATSTSCP
jgi:uncharacterized membrane protein YuzA (DUF378 family)